MDENTDPLAELLEIRDALDREQKAVERSQVNVERLRERVERAATLLLGGTRADPEPTLFVVEQNGDVTSAA